MTTTTIEKVKHPARIGDLLVIESERRDYVIGKPTVTRSECVVVEVAGTFRDGRVKTVRNLDRGGGYAQQLGRWIGLRSAWLIEAKAVNKAAAVEAILTHGWPGYSGDYPSIMPWDDLRELTTLLAGFRTAKTGWQVA